MPPAVGGAVSGYATGNAPATVSLAAIPDGAWMLATLFQEGSYDTAAAPSGWTNLLPNASQLSGTRGQAYAARIKAGDTSLSWGPAFTGQTGGRRLVVLWGTGSAPVSEWARGLVGVRSSGNVVSGQSVLAGSSTTSVAPSVTVPADDSLVIAIASEATSATGTFTFTSPGVTPFFSSGEADGIQFVIAAHFTANAGPTSPVTATAQASQAANGQGLQVAIPPADEPDPDPDPDPPAHELFTSVQQMLQTPGVTWAHRGGGGVWPEMSVYAYTQAAARGYGVLEVSFGRTSDGVWVGVHDNTLNRTSQTSGLPSINSMTWAQVQTYQVLVGGTGAPQPYSRWEDIRDGFGDTHILVLDPKNYNWGAHQTAFLDLCDELGPERVIVKQYASDVSLATAARARGYTTWGHTFDDFMTSPSLPTYLAAWDMLGIEIGASQSDWNVLLATGKPVIGHIAQSQAHYDTAMLKGAHGVQVSRVDLVEAVAAEAWVEPTPSGGSTAPVVVGTAGAGRKVARGGSVADVGAGVAGAGRRRAGGGSVAGVGVSVVGAGQRRLAGGSVVTIGTTPSGVGVKVGAGGSTVAATVTAVGSGQRVELGQGGSVADVDVAPSGSGRKVTRGGSVVDLTIGTVGQGHRVEAGSGGSVATVLVSTSGAGTTLRTGGSVATLGVTAVGTGRNPGAGRDITIHVGPWLPQTVLNIGPWRSE